jgi:8-amino-7-oxononanoate synthase
MNKILEQLHQQLQERKWTGVFRSLPYPCKGIDFYSNDYLGLSRDVNFQASILEKVNANPQCLMGSTGSRLISGNSAVCLETERLIAQKHGCASALLLPNGYMANLALFSSIPSRHYTIIVDELVHRSVHNGCLLSNARKWKFLHNDLYDLEQKLKRAGGPCYIAVESLYSTNGDFAPLKELADLAKNYNSALIVDEAHTFGIFGYGRVHQLGLQNKVFATLVTYGKAAGLQGAAVLCTDLVKDYLINFAAPLIYSTAISAFQYLAISIAYEALQQQESRCNQLQQRIQYFRNQGLPVISQEHSPIQSVVAAKQKLAAIQKQLREANFLTYVLYAPTVPQGQERLRLCLHSFNTEEEIRMLCHIINSHL